ncbi:MAG TPA: hypothetical protein DCQ84_10230, partial [Candidatus Competibacteraceae bacterium]|nr:hypothetical protein [Candidatus Competibacteraceae bacterium]
MIETLRAGLSCRDNIPKVSIFKEKIMQRREFIKKAGLGLATVAAGATVPALGQSPAPAADHKPDD